MTWCDCLCSVTRNEAIIIDPCIDCVDRDLQTIADMGLTLRYALNTHVHADHITVGDSVSSVLDDMVCVLTRSRVIDDTLGHWSH